MAAKSQRKEVIQNGKVKQGSDEREGCFGSVKSAPQPEVQPGCKVGCGVGPHSASEQEVGPGASNAGPGSPGSSF